ncbi:MAG TPA: response regulator transcription factor [Chloroflexota bacterium]|nr:response regulator transcription factor [Chloroflexota bacterium]
MLVVEDDANLQRAIRTGLERAGFIVATAGTGEGAVHWSSQVQPHAILLDMMLPDTDGRSVAAAIRERYGAQVPIVLVSGIQRLALRSIARDIGAFDYLTKPFVLSELVETVRRSIDQPYRS